MRAASVGVGVCDTIQRIEVVSAAVRSMTTSESSRQLRRLSVRGPVAGGGEDSLSTAIPYRTIVLITFLGQVRPSVAVPKRPAVLLPWRCCPVSANLLSPPLCRYTHLPPFPMVPIPLTSCCGVPRAFAMPPHPTTPCVHACSLQHRKTHERRLPKKPIGWLTSMQWSSNG